ncbi:MAG TPA: RNA 2',3'-cyclic phosphodiesterase [Fimbriiglobus sp.]|jgi:2'-5' RNA ligase
MARIRSFIGIEIDDGVRVAAETVQNDLARTGAQVKWVEPKNLHLTLVFLGDVHDRQLADLFVAVGQVAKTEPSFSLSVSGIGAFPTSRRPKVVWGGITTGAENLTRIHAALEEPLTALGLYRREDRGYTPHLTLGRVSGEESGALLSPELPKFADWSGGTTPVTQLVVFGSELRRDGPEYTVLGRCPLKGKRRA